MFVSRVDAWNSTFEKSNLWLRDLARSGPFFDERQAYSALRAVLHALRDRLRVDDAAHLAAQLPMLIRGMYYEGWKPSAVPTRERTVNDFLDHVEDNLGLNSEVDPETATEAVFDLLERKITDGEIRNIRAILPRELRMLWSAQAVPIPY